MWEVETTDMFDEWFHHQKQALKEDVLQRCIFFLSMALNWGGLGLIPLRHRNTPI